MTVYAKFKEIEYEDIELMMKFFKLDKFNTRDYINGSVADFRNAPCFYAVRSDLARYIEEVTLTEIQNSELEYYRMKDIEEMYLDLLEEGIRADFTLDDIRESTIKLEVDVITAKVEKHLNDLAIALLESQSKNAAR